MADRDTHNVNDLIERGKDALRDEEFTEAVDYFRRALRLAPMRTDIRELLALALDHQVLPEASDEVEEDEYEEDFELEEEEEPPPSRAPKRRRRQPHRPRRRLLTCLVLLILLILIGLGGVGVYVMYEEPLMALAKTHLPAWIFPTPEEEKQALALLEDAQPYILEREYDRAIDILEEALALNPPESSRRIKQQLASIYNAQGDDLFDEEKYLQAARSYDKAIEYDPENPEYPYDAGWAYYRHGLLLQRQKKSADTYLSRAQDAFEQALELDPDYLSAYEGLARVYIRRNRPGEAATIYRKIIDLAPESSEAQHAERQLKNMFGQSGR